METNTIIAIGVGVALFLGFQFMSARGTISSEAARQLVDGGAQLIDVRSPGEYAGGHIEGAKNIPVQQIAQRAGELGPKDQPIVLYCRSGARSGRAQKVLQDAGFSAVHNLGGMSRW